MPDLEFCLSVCLSVTLTIYAKRCKISKYILQVAPDDRAMFLGEGKGKRGFV